MPSGAEYTFLISKIKNFPSGAFSWILHYGATCNKGQAEVSGRGNVKLTVSVAGYVSKCSLQNVLHVSDFENSLIPVRSMGSKGIHITFRKGRCSVRKNGKLIVSVFLWGSLTYLRRVWNIKTVGSGDVAWLRLWHERISHVSEVGFLKMSERTIPRGLPALSEMRRQKLSSCVVSKTTHAAVPQRRSRPSH